MPDAGAWGQIEYVYDPAGRRIEKKVDGDTELKFLYDGDHIIAEYDANDTLLRKYVHGPCTDEPICMIESSGGYAGTEYYHYDALGNVVALTDPNGDVVQLYEYSVYGQVAASDPNHPNRFMFTGREFDFDTGLYNYRARYYNPEIGRFFEIDPGVYDDGTNLYTYCGNNAINLSDASGCMTEEEVSNAYHIEGDPQTHHVHSLGNFGDWLSWADIFMPAAFAADYLLNMTPEEIEAWKTEEEDRTLTLEFAVFYGVSVKRINGINILQNGNLDRILKAGDVNRYSFHEANQAEKWEWGTEWITRGPALYDYWCPFRNNNTGMWLYYERTDYVCTAGPFSWYCGIDYIGGKYDDSEIAYIMQGHAGRAVGIPLSLLVAGAHWHNHAEWKHWASAGEIFWLTKGYNEYSMRSSW